MKTKDFFFEIPDELIAQEPAAEREEARLLCMPRGGGKTRHRCVADLPELLPPGALMVFNNTRVRPCRLYGRRGSNGRRTEALLLERLNATEWTALLRPRLAVGGEVAFAEQLGAVVLGHHQDTVRLEFDRLVDDGYLERHGHVPLPPYIRRPDSAGDRQRYQTVYAQQTGSAAAPTAGLHFTPDLLQRIDERGIEQRFVTLHVGQGTFRPMRTEIVSDHRMHREWYIVPEETAAAVNAARSDGRPIVAVGTTSVRTLESAWDEAAGMLRTGSAETELFIYPGYRFRVVDEMVTNFHTPQSSLIVMVAAFAGREPILDAYRTAVAERYRFFSYGDAMYLHR